MKKIAVMCLTAALAALLCLSAAAAQSDLLTDAHIRYIQGSGEGFFRPNDTLTRAETAVMLSRLLLEPGEPAETAFTDLAPGLWYSDAVARLAGLELIRGYDEPDGTVTCRPGRSVSRAEFVTMLVRLLQAPEGETSFPDTETHWSAPAVSAAVRAGWLRGYAEPDGTATFRPDRTITRAEAVTMLNRALGRAADPAALEELDGLYYLDVPESAWFYGAVMEASIAHEHETDETGAERWTAVTADDAGFAMSNPIARAVAYSRAAGQTDQIIAVTGERLTGWERDDHGRWQLWLDVPCGLGKNGLGSAETRREGNLQTPLGDYPLTMAFGLADDPGAALPYRQITPRSYWSSESDETYNTWVESDRAVRGEHLADYTEQYRYAIVIGFNMDPPVIGRGSGIFLHCKASDHWYTAGCVSVEESAMVQILRRVGPGARILIAENAETLGAL